MKTSFSPKPRAGTDLYLIAVHEGDARKIKGKHAKGVRAILAANPDFNGGAGEVVAAVIPGFTSRRLGLLGLGPKKGRTALSLEKAGGKLLGKISPAVRNIFVDTGSAGLEPADIAAIASGVTLRGYEFRLYRTKNKDRRLPTSVTFSGGTEAQKAYAPMAGMAQAVHWARDMVNEPPNVLYPESFAKRVAETLKPLGVKVTILKDDELMKKGFGGIIGVGKASEHPPRLVLLEYKGTGAKGKPVALVGKGITFDTGGYSIKTNEGMQEMKCDMAGAAAVAGAFMALASAKAPVHVVGALAMAENMISDEGFKPGDILTSLSGQTIEVTNTDAEGRLVLCDALWHVQQTYKPRAVIDIATLTGAAMIALGEEYAAYFTTDDATRTLLENASKATGDKVWQLPLDEVFDRAMDSNVADMKNSSATRYGGSCTGAAFLSRFIKKDVVWAHIDMAPTMVVRSDSALCPKGPTGFGVRLLAQWAAQA